ncbi:expressed unknown protein [Seminavis robusta]|uniref:Uncharacterized protein n=1 Tax=Seminavis robusta TaxID=568900 RepID=A0A9N8DLS7_9STRA|nr:expressed unknown protein [Seminavis robusta]|eukprot:Sro230_g093290.1 n/a (301) ;mRNA; r:34318-35220
MKYQPRQQRAVSLVLLLAMASSSTAFMPPQPVQPRIPSVDRHSILLSKSMPDSHVLLHLSHGNNEANENWKALAQAAGDVARNVGSSVWDVIKKGGNKLKEFATNALLPAEPKSNDIFSNPTIVVDKEDENMFRGIFGQDIVVPSDSGRVVDQAALFLQHNEMAASLLGSSLQYGQPFSQSSSSTSINGRMSSSVQASFEVWGTQGQGVATATSIDGNLEYMDLEVNDRLYRLDINAPPMSTSNYYQATNPGIDPWSAVIYDDDEDDEDIVEVEVLEAVRSRSRYQGRVLDAEIVEKTFL